MREQDDREVAEEDFGEAMHTFQGVLDDAEDQKPTPVDRDTDTTRWWPGTSLGILSCTLPQKKHDHVHILIVKNKMQCQLAFFRTARIESC